jgi:2-keto-4-pentenoate hydratase/2-oxohepta-3-ene-1,7-dioic acid hydratase in catechol pathway
MEKQTRGERFMKIVRFLSDDGRAYLGALNEKNLEEAQVLEGDLFGAFKLTNRTEQITRLLPPVEPPNILAIGVNYGKHADEAHIHRPDLPILFIKATTSLIGPDDKIILPAAGPDQVDYEAELAVVIGKKAKNVRRENALQYVLGYTCANDVSARDWQIEKQNRQWARGKSFDTFCPLGPCLVTADEITTPNNLRLRSILNGQVMQDSTTANMTFDVPSLISDLSRSMTLLPGTVILTGTPEGVGYRRNPPVFLKNGDEIVIEIQNIGRLANKVAYEKM